MRKSIDRPETVPLAQGVFGSGTWEPQVYGVVISKNRFNDAHPLKSPLEKGGRSLKQCLFSRPMMAWPTRSSEPFRHLTAVGYS